MALVERDCIHFKEIQLVQVVAGLYWNLLFWVAILNKSIFDLALELKKLIFRDSICYAF